MFTRMLSRPRWAADDRSGHVGVGCLLEDGVEDRNRALGAVDAEPLLAHVLGGEEALERLRRVQPTEDVELLVDRQLVGDALDLLLDPALLVRLLDVHVLDADRAAVRVAEDAEDVAHAHGVLAADGRIDAGHAPGQELAVEVPDGQAVGRGVELGVHLGLFGRQRIEVGDQMAAHAVLVDQLDDLHLLGERGLLVIGGVHVATPAHGFVRDPDRAEHLFVEVVVADEEIVNPLEEQAGLGPLDDPVVVGRGQGDDLRHPELRQRLGVGTLPLGGVVERPHADDRTLPGHQPGDRLHGADGAGVGQGDRRAHKVVGAELVGAHLADELLVPPVELGEAERVGIADAGDEQRAAAIGLLDVDGDPQPDVGMVHDAWRAVGTLGVGRVQGRHRVRRGPHDGVPDQVGERHLSSPLAGQVAVDDLAVDLEELGGHGSEAGRRRDLETRLHVGDDASGRTPQRLTDRLRRGLGRRCGGCRFRGGGRRRCGGRCRLTCRSGGGGGRRRGGRGLVPPVVLEEVPPALAHGLRIGAVLLVHLVDEPVVGTEAGRLREQGGRGIAHLADRTGVGGTQERRARAESGSTKHG
jgi:hypothetical protein